MSANSDNFFKDIECFPEFLDVMNPDHYHDVPDDWLVAVADVKGSTQAFKDGKYKDVNVVGASSIIAVLNAIKGHEIPFVFGGDGASFVLPPSLAGKVAAALDTTRDMAQQSFGFELRCGIVPVSEIKAQGFHVSVAKYRVSEHVQIAMFNGGGLACADDIVKGASGNDYDVSRYVNGDRPGAESFEGLECRWNPIRATRGQAVTLMVQSRWGNGVYKDVLETIQRIHGTASEYSPINPKKMFLSFKRKNLRQEFGVQTYNGSRAEKRAYARKLFFHNLIGWFLFKFNISFAGVEGNKYKGDAAMNSDFQKFDDTLRMILNSTPAQSQRLKEYLEESYKAGKLYYGLNISDSVMMTCLIFNYTEDHLHFLDGAAGGYTLAAKAMKEQIRTSQAS